MLRMADRRAEADPPARGDYWFPELDLIRARGLLQNDAAGSRDERERAL